MTVHEDEVVTPDGRSTQYGWVETPPAVYVVAMNDEEEVVLVKQLRYTTGQPSWELPGGSSNGEDGLEAAKREFEEEAGMHAEKWVSLKNETYAWNGIATQRNSVHIATDLHKAKHPRPDADDVIVETKAFSWDQIKAMIGSGELNDGESVAALMLAGLHLGAFK